MKILEPVLDDVSRPYAGVDFSSSSSSSSSSKKKKKAVVVDKRPYALCVEASHSRPRIVHWRDHTGRAIMESLLASVRAHPNIDLRCGATAVDLLVADVQVPLEENDEDKNEDRSSISIGLRLRRLRRLLLLRSQVLLV